MFLDLSKLELLSFADGTIVYQSYPYIDINISINNINQELKHLYDWLCANKLTIYVSRKILYKHFAFLDVSKLELLSFADDTTVCQSYSHILIFQLII